ncbi:hypothetical protein MEN41_17640 [Dolichospermum sp. ST_con]|nr:hypothetical protein [Dolichospermum sp. ST_con]MDD1418533.1 hypothetical protein [Dolichospermum sp. ST_sed1]MDD1423884.1 hypothetical protein [Dolichospermum sp. ST_sed9]MDD1431587.1 hypothetical protein [Dolichospermum sp. ST_sed6]MDD1436086.1 hypothetical protein [Dolichospermum sp. ST_sed10]MDD1440856.1 hypothetical protein [Dolichospermum sp. ST_sed3]MDD1447012.1 hypothetical protein [Dolichospermum sp. ST_sed8]MDD1454170.1 hypothetical protein [Dolichospermum sp. ST_sed7]MDD145875
MTLKIANTINLQIQYITNENGEKTAVILPIDQFEHRLKNIIQLQPNDEVKNQELTNKNIWEIAQEITEDITGDELQQLPHDGFQKPEFML